MLVLEYVLCMPILRPCATHFQCHWNFGQKYTSWWALPSGVGGITYKQVDLSCYQTSRLECGHHLRIQILNVAHWVYFIELSISRVYKYKNKSIYMKSCDKVWMIEICHHEDIDNLKWAPCFYNSISCSNESQTLVPNK